MNWLNDWRRRRDAGEAGPDDTDPEIARLLDRARALPRDLAPQRDLWSGVENRISGRVPADEPSPWSLAALFPRPLAASAVALMLVATTAISVLWIAGMPAGSPSDAEMAAIAAGLRERDGVAEVHQSLIAIVEAHRADLPAETVAVLDDNLRSIDRAIAEIHLALESNPDHHALSFLLAEAYRSEAELLERLEWWLETPEGVTS